MHVNVGLLIYNVMYFIIYVIIYTNKYNIYKKKRDLLENDEKSKRNIYKYIRKVRETD